MWHEKLMALKSRAKVLHRFHRDNDYKMQQKGLQCMAGLLITECDKSKLQSTMVFGLQSATRWVTKCNGMTNYDGTCVSNTYGVNILLVSI